MKKILIGFCIFLSICVLLAIMDPPSDTLDTNDPSKTPQEIPNNNTVEQENNNNNEELPEENINPVEKPPYDIEISLKEMANVYYNNELNGNKQFFGKRVKTQAKFTKTSNGIFSGLIAYFDGGNSIYDVHCTSFDKETESILSELNRNETVNIIGTVDELVSTSINFENCKIYK